MNNRKKKNMKDKKWDILVVCVLAVLAILFLFLNGKEATVTFDSAGGSVVNSVKVKVNDNVSKPVNPTREGYNFVRWELDDKEYDFTDKVTSNITLKAVWKKKSDGDVTYTITLDIDGKTENVKVTDGKINSLPSPSKEGYVFVDGMMEVRK